MFYPHLRIPGAESTFYPHLRIPEAESAFYPHLRNPRFIPICGFRKRNPRFILICGFRKRNPRFILICGFRFRNPLPLFLSAFRIRFRVLSPSLLHCKPAKSIIKNSRSDWFSKANTLVWAEPCARWAELKMLSFWVGGISSFPPCAREYRLLRRLWFS